MAKIMITKDELIYKLEEYKENELNRFLISVCPENGNIYLCGGFIRDLILGKNVEDINDVDYVTSNCSAIETCKKVCEKFDAKFEKIGTDIARIRFKNGFSTDISGHNATIQDISQKADYTSNSLYYHINGNEKLIDLTDGFNDIKNNRLKIISEKSITRSPRVVLRGARFQEKTGLKIDNETLELFQKNKHLYPNLGINFKRADLIFLCSLKKGSGNAFKFLHEQKLLNLFYPYFKNESAYLKDDLTDQVITKAIKTMNNIEKLFYHLPDKLKQKLSSDVITDVPYIALIKMATLFNDLGEIAPLIPKEGGKGFIQNFIESSVPAKNVLAELSTHPKAVDYVATIISQSRYTNTLIKIDKKYLEDVINTLKSHLKESFEDIIFFTLSSLITETSDESIKENYTNFYMDILNNKSV